jgi:hypothetical protein
MISLDRCRQILGPHCHLSDADLALVREHLYALAQTTVELFLERRRDQGDASFTSGPTDKERSERAAGPLSEEP